MRKTRSSTSQKDGAMPRDIPYVAVINRMKNDRRLNIKKHWKVYCYTANCQFYLPKSLEVGLNFFSYIDNINNDRPKLFLLGHLINDKRDIIQVLWPTFDCWKANCHEQTNYTAVQMKNRTICISAVLRYWDKRVFISYAI